MTQTVIDCEVCGLCRALPGVDVGTVEVEVEVEVESCAYLARRLAVHYGS